MSDANATVTLANGDEITVRWDTVHVPGHGFIRGDVTYEHNGVEIDRTAYETLLAASGEWTTQLH